MSSFTNATRQVSVGLHALETIGKLAKTLIPDGEQGRAEQALGILTLITQVYDAVTDGIAKGIDVGDIEIELQSVMAGADSNRQAFEDRIDARFPVDK